MEFSSLKDVKNGISYSLEESKSERDLGVQVTNNLKWEEQANLAASKAKRIFGVLKKAFKCWENFTQLTLGLIWNIQTVYEIHTRMRMSVFWKKCKEK